MTTLRKRRKRGHMIQTRRILNGKDGVDPAGWFRLQKDQTRAGAISTRRHHGYQVLFPRPPSMLEARRNFFSNRVVDGCKILPDSMKRASSVNGFKVRLDEFLGAPEPLLRREGRRETARPHYRGGDVAGDQQVV